MGEWSTVSLISELRLSGQPITVNSLVCLIMFVGCRGSEVREGVDPGSSLRQVKPLTDETLGCATFGSNKRKLGVVAEMGSWGAPQVT